MLDTIGLKVDLDARWKVDFDLWWPGYPVPSQGLPPRWSVMARLPLGAHVPPKDRGDLNVDVVG